MTTIEGWNEAGLNLELFFCTDILKLDSLHYGYWEEPEPLDLASIRAAQTRYTETLLTLVPDGVRAVLDVGCGIGDVTAALAQRGYRVTALSPDRNHARFWTARAADSIRFEQSTFENFQTEDRFDLILMSESQDYFDLDAGLIQCRRLLKPGGYLLVSGNFKRRAGPAFAGCHLEAEYTRRARSHQLVLQQRIDITAQVLPTLVFAQQAVDQYIAPIGQMADHFLGKPFQMKRRLLSLFFRQEFRQVEQVRAFYAERFDITLYQQHARYLRLLFQYQPEEVHAPVIVEEPAPPAAEDLAGESCLPQTGELTHAGMWSGFSFDQLSRLAQAGRIEAEQALRAEPCTAIVCAYNEEKTVAGVVERLLESPEIQQVIVVDDGSTDGTTACLKELAQAAHGRVRVVCLARNRGKGYALAEAIAHARTELLLLVDADLANWRPEYVRSLIEPLISGQADMVIGYPVREGDRLDRVPFLRGLRKLSGERAVWLRDLLPILGLLRASRYGVETLLNRHFEKQGRRVVCLPLRGLVHLVKTEKLPWHRAAAGYARESWEVLQGRRTALSQ